MAKTKAYSASTYSSSSSSSINGYTTSRREVFTIWMKSLVFHGNGCTVYDSAGRIVYRIDNYDQKRNNEISLMDLHGRLLFSIRQKRAPVFRQWDGYKTCDSKAEMPWFQVRKDHTVLRGDSSCYHVTLWGGGGGEGSSSRSCLKMLVGLGGSSNLIRMIDGEGRVVAEVKQKTSTRQGAHLGDDVLSLVVEPHVDHSFIMALVTVCNLSLRKL